VARLLLAARMLRLHDVSAGGHALPLLPPTAGTIHIFHPPCTTFFLHPCTTFSCNSPTDSSHLSPLTPIQKLGPPVTWQEATFMVWGGLRGAVGLALAIVVDRSLYEMAAHELDQGNQDKVSTATSCR
jgi:hypothetical protein